MLLWFCCSIAIVPTMVFFFFSSRRRHTRYIGDWSSDVALPIFAEAGLPEGVLSVVPGGIETGKALTSNPDVDMLTFTGSSAVGKEVGKRAADMLKPCTLELGGKSAAIILEDVDLPSAVPML